ncbi:methyltransferase domain-containing protein [Thermodesulfobacteriota bacterium]
MINKVIMKRLGNRSLAIKAAKKYHLNSITTKEARITNKFSYASFIFQPLKIMIGILCCVLYAVFLPFNIIYLLYIYLKNRQHISYKEYIPNWEKLYEHWGRYPSCFITKATEYTYYHGLHKNIYYNSLEIGVYSGETSRGFFNNKIFDAGIEYNIDRLIVYIKGENIHSHLYCADVSMLPFQDETFHNIICVHSIDDMEVPAAVALEEMVRVLKPGGSIVFSGITENFTRHNLIVRILRAIGLKKISKIVFENIYIGSSNCYNKLDWERIFDKIDCEVIKFHTYVPFNYSGFFDLSYRPEVVLLNVLGLKNLLEPFVRNSMIKKLLFRSAAAMTYLSNTKTTQIEGINFFCIARKIKSNHNNSNESVFSGNLSLLCPKCHGNVFLVNDIDNVEIKKFLCSTCKNEYTIVKGIPVFLVLNKIDY